MVLGIVGSILRHIDLITASKKRPFWEANSAWSLALPAAPRVLVELDDVSSDIGSDCPEARWLTRVVKAADWANIAWAKVPPSIGFSFSSSASSKGWPNPVIARSASLEEVAVLGGVWSSFATSEILTCLEATCSLKGLCRAVVVGFGGARSWSSMICWRVMSSWMAELIESTDAARFAVVGFLGFAFPVGVAPAARTFGLGWTMGTTGGASLPRSLRLPLVCSELHLGNPQHPASISKPLLREL